MWHPSSSLSSHVHTSALWTAEESFAHKQKSEYERLQRHIEAHEGRLQPFHYAPITASTLAAAGKNAPTTTQSLMLGVAGEDDDKFRTSKVMYPSSYGMSSAGQALDLAVATPTEVEAEAARIKMGQARERRDKKREAKASSLRSILHTPGSRPGTSSAFTFNKTASAIDEETKSPSSRTHSPNKHGGPTSPPFRDLSAPTGLSVGDHLATHTFASPNEASNFLATLGQAQRKEIYHHRFMGKVWGVLDKNQAPLSPAAALGYSSTPVVPNSALLASLGLKSPISVEQHTDPTSSSTSENKKREMEQAEYYFRMSQKLQAENSAPQIMTIPSRPGTTMNPASRANNRTESALAHSLEKPLWNSAISTTSPVKARTRAAISRNVFDVSDNDTTALAGHHFPSAHGHGRHTSLEIHQLQRPVTSHINQQKDKHHHHHFHGDEERPKTSRAILSTSLESPRNAQSNLSPSASRPRTSGGHHQAVNMPSGAVLVSNNSQLNSSGTAPAMGKFIDPKASSVHWSNRIYTKHSGSGMTKEQMQLSESMKAHQKSLANRAARFKKGVKKSLADSTMMNAKQREEQEMLIMQLRSEIGSGDEANEGEEEKRATSGPAEETANLFLSAATIAGNDYATPQKDSAYNNDSMMMSHSTLFGMPPSSSASLGLNPSDPHSKPLPSQIRRDRKYSELESKFLAEFSNHVGDEFAQLFHDTSFHSYNAADQSSMNQQRLKLIEFEMAKEADLDVHNVAFQMKRLLLAKQNAENETRHQTRRNIETQHWKTGEIEPHQSNLMAAAALQMHLKSIPTSDAAGNGGGNNSSLVKSIHDQLLKERLEDLSFAKAEGATIAKGESDLPDLQHSVFSIEDSANAEQKARYITHFLQVAQVEQQEQIRFQNQILSEDSAFSHRFKIEEKETWEENLKKQRREQALQDAHNMGNGSAGASTDTAPTEEMTELEKSLTMARLKTEQSLQGQLSHFASKIEPAHLVALHQATNDVLDPKALVAAERAAERERIEKEKADKEKEELASSEEEAAKKAAAAVVEEKAFPPAPVLTAATLAALHAAAPAARTANISTLHTGQQDPEELDSLNPPTAEVVAAAQKELRPLASILQLHNLSEEAQRLIDETAANVRDKLTVENASIRAENLLQAEKLQFQQARDREIEMAALVRHEKNQMALRATRRNLVRSGDFKFSLWGVHQIAKGVPKGCIVRFELKLMYSSPDLPMIVAYSTPFDPHAPVTAQASRRSTQTSVVNTRSNTPGLYATPSSWNHSLKAAATVLTGAGGGEADVSPVHHELFQSVTFPILNAHTQKLRVSLQVLTPRQMLHWLFSNRTELFHSTFSRAMTPLPSSRAATSLNNEAEFRTLMVYLQCCETDILNGAAVIAASPLNNKMKRRSFGSTTPLPMTATARPKSSAATSANRPPAFPTINPSAIVATAAMQQVASARGGNRPHTSHASTAVVPFGRSPQSLHAALVRPQTMQLGRNIDGDEVGDDQDPMVAYQRGLDAWFNSGSKKSSPQPSPRQGSTRASTAQSQQPHITARENAILTAVIDESDTDNFEKWLIHMREILLSHKHFDSGLSKETHLVAPPAAPTSITAVTTTTLAGGDDSDDDEHKMSYGAGLRFDAMSKWSEEQVTVFLKLLSLGDTTIFHKREINGHQLLLHREELERFVEQTGAGRARKFPARDATNEELARAQPIIQGNATLIAQGLATTGFSPANKYKSVAGGKFSPALPSHVLVGLGGGNDSGRSTPSTSTPASGRTSRNHARSQSISAARGTAQSLSWNPVEEATSKGSLQRASDALKLLRALQLLSGQFPSMSIDASKEDSTKEIIDMSHIAGLRKEIFRAYNAVCHMPSYVAAVGEAKNDAEARATTSGLGEDQIMDLSQRLSSHKNYQAETEAKNLAAIGVLPCDANGNLIPPSDFSGAGSASATRAALLDKQMQAREAKRKHNEILSVLRTTQIRSMDHLDGDIISQYKSKLHQRQEDRIRYQEQQAIRQKQLQEDQKMILKQNRKEQDMQNGVEIEDEDDEDEAAADAEAAEIEERRAQIQNQHLLALPPRSSTAPTKVQPSPRGVPVVSATTYNMLEMFQQQSRPSSRAANPHHPQQALIPAPPMTARPATGIAGLGTASRVGTAISGGRGIATSSGASSSSSSSPSNSNEGITIAYFELSVRRVARGIEGVFSGSMRLHASDDPAGLSSSGTTGQPPVAPSAAPNGGITTGSGGIATLAGVGREGEDSAGRSLSSRALYRSELEASRTLHSGSARTFMPGSATASMRQKRLAGSPADQARSSNSSSSQNGSSSNTPVVSAHTPRSWLRKSLQAQAEMEVHAAAWSWLRDARVDIEAVFTPSAEEIKDKE